MRYLCRRDLSFGLHLMFKKDIWYNGTIHCDTDGKTHIIVMRWQSDNKSRTFEFLHSEIGNYFYSIDEVREMEINKIIN